MPESAGAAAHDVRGAEVSDPGSPAVVVALHQLLSAGLPVHPTVRLGSAHVVAAAGHSAGGDWYDVVPFADGRLALIVGDVVGGGLGAAVVMAQLRAVLRELLLSGVDLETALDRMTARVTDLRGAEGTTLCVGLLDPRSGSLRYATCGHPPPLVVDGSGGHRFLAPTGGGPLGGGPGHATRRETLAGGETLVLYTDGLIERPGRTLADGSAELGRVAEGAAARPAPGGGRTHAAVDQLVSTTLEELTRGGCADDAIVLAAQLLDGPTADLRLIQDATPIASHRIRRQLDAWLAELGLDAGQLNALHLAVTEAVTNSIEHAYPADSPGRVELRAWLTAAGEFVGVVTDHGSWREPDRGHSYRGRGVALMSGIVDQMHIGPASGGGTVVTLRHRLARPEVPVRPAARPLAGDQRTPYRATVEWLRTPLVRVAGPVDIATADELDALLRTTARGGAVDLAVDLSEVTLLGSAGVRVLTRLAAHLRAQRCGFELRTSPGSPARHVLDLVGLPYLSSR